jgi:transketolase C-terminal domain/subunit/transketolase N-terminal domain/subunit
MSFPLPVENYRPVAVDPFAPHITEADKAQLRTNVQILRDTIVFFTAVAGIKGYSGHTGGAYDVAPEAVIIEAFARGSQRIYPVLFDEAGHRVALQYALAAFRGNIPFELLLEYRAAYKGLYGHPEKDPHVGIHFASGRLGHLWPFVNGVAKANPDRTVFVLGSDGSQMEGNDAEAARLAVAQRLNVKLCIDDNNVTISGHPREYLPGFDVARTLQGHGLTVDVGEGEDFDALLQRLLKAVQTDGPVALVNRRTMAPGIPGIEGSNHAHDVIKKDHALEYLSARGYDAAVAYLQEVKAPKSSVTYLGSSSETYSNRSEFGVVVSDILDEMSPEERTRSVLVIDSDLEGSTGLNTIRKRHPEVCINGGVQERGNLSLAAGFGFEKGKQGIFSTFSAFLEMVISELTMARLNEANLLCHFSHAGIDEIADNTCHYGINIFLAHSGLMAGDKTRLYFPADALQLRAVVRRIWNDEGIRFVFSTRSKAPYILRADGKPMYGEGYTFEPGKDEIVREGTAGYVVSYGVMLYRALDAVERARAAGIPVGLINKVTLNVVDEERLAQVGRSPFVLVVEDQNLYTGLGSRLGTWLLQRGHAPRYDVMAVTKPGCGGLSEHIPYQGLAPKHILERIQQMAR